MILNTTKCGICIALIFYAVPFIGAKNTFKDASPKITKAVEDFRKRGIMDGFISKYGNTYFRPTSSVTREEMLLALLEYDRMVKTLVNYRAQLSKSVLGIKKRMDVIERNAKTSLTPKSDKRRIDELVKEIQNRMPVLMESAPVQKKVDAQLKTMNRKIELLELGSGKDSNAKNISLSKLDKMIKAEVKRVLAKEKPSRVSGKKKTHGDAAGSSKILRKLTISLGMLAAVFLAR